MQVFHVVKPYTQWFTSWKVTIPKSQCLLITVSHAHYCGCEPEKPLCSRREQFPITFPEVLQNFSINNQNIFKLKTHTQTNKQKTPKFSVALKCLILFPCLGLWVYCKYTIIFKWRVMSPLLFKAEDRSDQYVKLHNYLRNK